MSKDKKPRLPSTKEIAEGTYEANVANEEFKAKSEPLMLKMQETSKNILAQLNALYKTRDLLLDGMNKGLLNTKQDLIEVNAWIQAKEKQAIKLRDLAQSLLDKIEERKNQK